MLWDGSLKHFGVRVSAGGAKAFIVLLGSGRRQAIGRFPTITLAEARTKAKRILAERTLGRHQIASTSWQAAIEKFLSARETKTRGGTHAEYVRMLARYFPFGTMRLSEISKRDIASKLEKLTKTPSQQAHALVVCKMFFRWSLANGYVEVDPTVAFKSGRQTKRARVLTDDELRAVWKASEQCGTFGVIVKVLILTGQRRGEIVALRSTFFKDNVCTLPPDLCKNGREHSFPIGATTAALLASRLLSANTCNDPTKHSILFPARGSATLFNAWSKSKAELDKISGVTDWTLHDLRRTFATRLAEMGTAPHIIERLLNHVSGTIGAVAEVVGI
jgi:integrase